MREHPDRETLQQFISGQLGSEDARLTDRHLAVCSECRDRADEVSEWLALQLLDSWLRPGYDEAFERAADKAAERLAVVLAEARSVEDIFAQLMQEPASERRRKVASEERFRTIKLSQLLRSRSRERWSSDPGAAMELADLAVEVALHLDAGLYGSSLAEDARALAWGYLGNSFRITSDLWRAEQALRQAWSHHLHSEDLFTETEILGFTSSLRIAQGLYDEATQLSDRSIAIYRQGQDFPLEGSALIKKGVILCYQGHYREAISVTQAGLEKISPDDNPRLSLTGKHNLIWSLSHAGLPVEARKLLEQSRSLYLERVDLIRLRWLEGLVARNLNQFAEAEKALCDVRDFFLESQIGSEVVLVSLDLAEIYIRQSRCRQAMESVKEIIPLGEALGLRKKVLVARLLYERASRG